MIVLFVANTRIEIWSQWWSLIQIFGSFHKQRLVPVAFRPFNVELRLSIAFDKYAEHFPSFGINASPHKFIGYGLAQLEFLFVNVLNVAFVSYNYILYYLQQVVVIELSHIEIEHALENLGSAFLELLWVRYLTAVRWRLSQLRLVLETHMAWLHSSQLRVWWFFFEW